LGKITIRESGARTPASKLRKITISESGARAPASKLGIITEERVVPGHQIAS